VVAVVLTWNGRRWIEPCLDALLASDYPALDVIVVDNGSTDGTLAAVAAYRPRLRLLENGRNLGYAAGNNIGLRAAREAAAEFVALINQDTRVDPGWLTPLVEAAIADDRRGLLSPVQWDYDGRGLDRAFRALVAAADPGAAEALGAGERVGGVIAVPTVIGAALLLRRRVIEEVGGFDPIYFVYYEEADLCRRARWRGFDAVVVPRSRVYHWHGLDHPADLSRRASLLSLRNQFVYELKDPTRGVGANLGAWLRLGRHEVGRCLRHPRGIRGGAARAGALVLAQGWLLLDLPRILRHRARERRGAAHL
jgi:hypothetical protein